MQNEFLTSYGGPPKAKIMIATPSISHQSHTKYNAAQNQFNTLAPAFGIETVTRALDGHSLIPVGRTILARDFIDSDCTHLLFWDSDIGADPHHIIDMVQADVPLIGAVCVQKRYDWDAIKRAVLANPTIDPQDIPKAGGIFTFSTTETGIDVDTSKREPLPVRYVGCGLTLIRRDCIERVAEHNKFATVNLAGGRPFPAIFAQRIVKCTDGSQDWLSEDYAFCSRAFDVGIQPMLCWWAKTSHTGQHTFEGDILTAGELLGGISQKND